MLGSCWSKYKGLLELNISLKASRSPWFWGQAGAMLGFVSRKSFFLFSVLPILKDHAGLTIGTWPQQSGIRFPPVSWHAICSNLTHCLSDLFLLTYFQTTNCFTQRVHKPNSQKIDSLCSILGAQLGAECRWQFWTAQKKMIAGDIFHSKNIRQRNFFLLKRNAQELTICKWVYLRT